ncbi:MAG: hypothetical protein JO331_00855 [Verrucomicrobia bacterium]|nr:hypothetical protein [Verrucomicrobiota bacterium]
MVPIDSRAQNPWTTRTATRLFGLLMVISLLGSLTIIGGFIRLLTYFVVRSAIKPVHRCDGDATQMAGHSGEATPPPLPTSLPTRPAKVDAAKGDSYFDFSQPLMKQPLKVQGFRFLLGGLLAAFLAILGTAMLAMPDLPELPRMFFSRFQFIGLIGSVLIPFGACCLALHLARVLIVRAVLRRVGLRVDTNEPDKGPLPPSLP